MAKRSFVCDTGDLMTHGCSMGYQWNEQCEWFDHELMNQESHNIEIWYSDSDESNPYGWPEGMRLIIRDYMEKQGVKEMVVSK